MIDPKNPSPSVPLPKDSPVDISQLIPNIPPVSGQTSPPEPKTAPLESLSGSVNLNAQPISVPPAMPQPVSPPSPVVSAAPPVEPQPMQMVTEVVAPLKETFVVPTGAVPEPSPAQPLHAPQGVIPQQTLPNTSSPPPPVHRGSFLGGVVKFLVFLLFLGILAGAGYFGWKMFSSQGQVTLTYWGLWEPEEVIRPILADFEAKNPQIKVVYTKQSPRQYRQRLASAIERGEGPDIFRFHNTWVAMLRNELAPVPDTVLSLSEFTNTFYDVAKRDLVGGSTIYGLPLTIDGLGLFVNDDLLLKAGVTVPVTWEDMLSVVPKLTVRDGDAITTSAIALGTTGNVEHFSDILGVMFLQNGADIANPVGREAQEALLFYRKFSDPTDPVYTWNANLDNSLQAFASGRLAMMLAPSWRAFDIAQINPTVKFRIVPIPQLPGNTVTWASYWVEGVSTKSKHQKQAFTLLKYLVSNEALMKLYTESSKVRLFGEPYARKDLAGSLTSDQYVGAYISQAPNARSFPLASKTSDEGLNDQMIKYLEDAVNGLQEGAAPSAVLQTAAAGFRQVLTRYGLVTSATTQ